ncbi:MAG: TonB-dependent receptor, partial [Verrucomicrobiae bacterium]|nr:TonB-dependent receptor [Verrucomicrobiae bacterium]
DMVQDQSDLRYDLDDPKFPTTRITNDRELRDPTAYLLEDLEDRYFLGDESDRIAAINIRQKNLFGYSNMFVKGGYKTRSRKYHRISAVDIYDNYEGTFTLADILSDASFPELLEGRYHLDTLPDPVGAKQFFESNRDGFLLNERRTRENSDPNTYHVNETVDAVYGMINFESGRWRSILGFRNESTEVDFLGNEVVLGKNEEGETVYLETNPVPGKSSYAHLFPNAHFRYKWTDKVTLIGSFSKTIDRPAYTYLVPYRRVNLEEQQIDEGNPNLLPTIFTNYDLSVDLALPKRALLSLELFSRSVEDFIFSRNQIVADGIYKGFELDRVENSSEADIHGATLTWRQPLESFRLPEGLSLNANYTTQKTQIEYPARPNEILPLTHMPENELKLTLSYQKDKFFAQLRYTYEDLVPSRIAGTADEDLYYLPNDQVNMSLTYQLRKNVRLFADVQNLTNEASYDRYEGDPGRPAGYRYLPWSMSSGIRVEL